MKKSSAIFTLTLLLLALPLLTFAAAPEGGLVPVGCQTGCPCSFCDLYDLADNIIGFLLYIIAVPVAAGAFLYGGVLMLTSGGNPSQITKGRGVMTNAVIGMALAFFAWAIFNTILSTIGFGIKKASWYDIPKCDPGGGTASCNVDLGKEVTVDPVGPVLAGRNFTGNIDDGCFRDGVNICGADGSDLLNGNEGLHQEAKSASMADLARYESVINALAAQYGVDPDRIRAIIAAESSGNENATHQDRDGKSSYGLMQVRMDTACQIDPPLCSLSPAEARERLSAPSYNLEMGIAYYKQMLNKYGGDETLASAAYNGGPGANNNSTNCPGQLRWQCEWDDDPAVSGTCNSSVSTAGCKRNTGYQVTRDYTGKLNDLENQYRGN
ncbi:MAG: transglycosylase SLT domain-containing protein [Patescibacteria group bacterium]